MALARTILTEDEALLCDYLNESYWINWNVVLLVFHLFSRENLVDTKFLPRLLSFLFFRNSQEPNSSVLADIELQFVSDELDPIKHLRAIVSNGHISGMMVYPDYFVVLGGKFSFLDNCLSLWIRDKTRAKTTVQENSELMFRHCFLSKILLN